MPSNVGIIFAIFTPFEIRWVGLSYDDVLVLPIKMIAEERYRAVVRIRKEQP